MGVDMSTSVEILVGTMIAASVLPGVIYGQTKAEEPINTTVCDLVKNPKRYNGKIIIVRAPIQIAFENFGLSVSECAEKEIDYVWLEYGRGPKRQPTIWCCGDMVPRDPLVLVQNKEFHRFHHFITAEKSAKGCYDCYLYHVTATLTGRFDALEPKPFTLCGFGHLGDACGRLVIREVSDVVANPIDPAVYEKNK